MIKELKRTEGMSNKEMMYVVANIWIDDICFKAVEEADKIMENPILNSIIRQAAEQILYHEEMRKKMAMGEYKYDEFWYESAKKDIEAYKTVLYDNLFKNYGSNSRDVI